MNISNKSRYGLKAMVYLGLKYTKENVSIKEISEKHNISKRYLEQIFAELKKGGLINSVKGINGGYLLSKAPSEITVGEVLRLLEGSLNIIEDVETGGLNVEDIEFTIKIKVWDEISKSINSIVGNITIKDIINDYYTTSQGMFYI